MPGGTRWRLSKLSLQCTSTLQFPVTPTRRGSTSVTTSPPGGGGGLLVKWANPKDFHISYPTRLQNINSVVRIRRREWERTKLKLTLEPNIEHASSPLSPRTPCDPREGSQSEREGACWWPGGACGTHTSTNTRCSERGQYSCCTAAQQLSRLALLQ